jgi:hypothetical protein
VIAVQRRQNMKREKPPERAATSVWFDLACQGVVLGRRSPTGEVRLRPTGEQPKVRSPGVKPKTRKAARMSGEFEDLGGADGDRTHDLSIANAALSQLSYGPTRGGYYLDLERVASFGGGAPKGRKIQSLERKPQDPAHTLFEKPRSGDRCRSRSRSPTVSHRLTKGPISCIAGPGLGTNFPPLLG